ncbi:hypothetical protein LTR12_018063 [Friedmanniomyces endolithicus]|nr:hypothetical protein LTR12_018063 [Friedmanniomyces endolithicus]
MAQPTDSNELVSRRATMQDTRFQRERRARADAGDLQARLDLLPLNVVEDQLSRCFRSARPDCSILTCLRGTDEAVAGHEAAAVVLEELADSTEQAAFTSALVYRYIQAHCLWKGHPNPHVTSAETFLDTLENSDYVRANIVIGSSADISKQRSLRLRDPRWARSEECSKRLLGQITTSARRGYSLDQAIEHWTQSMRRRTDEKTRREHRIGLPRSPYIILDDVRSLNQTVRADADPPGVATESPIDDRLRVELVTPITPGITPRSKPDYSAAKPSRTSKKRKQDRPEITVEDRSDEDGGWRVLANGKGMVRRVGNVLVRKPVATRSSGLISSNAPSSQQSASPSQPPSPQPQVDGDTPHSLRTCDGPGVALLLHKLIDAFREMPILDNYPNAGHGCCEMCRPKALRAFKVLENVLLPCAGDLEKIRVHHFGGSDVPTNQITNGSPHKHGLIREHSSLFIQDSSDEN